MIDALLAGALVPLTVILTLDAASRIAGLARDIRGRRNVARWRRRYQDAADYPA